MLSGYAHEDDELAEREIDEDYDNLEIILDYDKSLEKSSAAPLDSPTPHPEAPAFTVPRSISEDLRRQDLSVREIAVLPRPCAVTARNS